MVAYVVKSIVLGLKLKLGDALFESFAKKHAISNLGSGQMLLILAPQKLCFLNTCNYCYLGILGILKQFCLCDP